MVNKLGNRKKAEALILEYINAIQPGNENVGLYKAKFKAMSDGEFDVMMNSLESGDLTLPFIAPNGTKKIDPSNNVKLMRKLGHEAYQQLILTDEASGTTYLTPRKYLVIDLPLRRQVQLLTEKMSVAKDNTTVDQLTGAPVRDSKGSSLSGPEMALLSAQGLNNVIVELMSARGGDGTIFRDMNRSIIETGGANVSALKVKDTRPKVTESLSTYFKAAHLNNNL